MPIHDIQANGTGTQKRLPILLSLVKHWQEYREDVHPGKLFAAGMVEKLHLTPRQPGRCRRVARIAFLSVTGP